MDWLILCCRGLSLPVLHQLAWPFANPLAIRRHSRTDLEPGHGRALQDGLQGRRIGLGQDPVEDRFRRRCIPLCLRVPPGTHCLPFVLAQGLGMIGARPSTVQAGQPGEQMDDQHRVDRVLATPDVAEVGDGLPFLFC